MAFAERGVHGAIRRFRTAVFQEEEWDLGLDRIVDFSRAEGPEFSSDDIRTLVQDALEAGARLGTGRLAVIVPYDFHFGMARMYGALEGDVSQRPLALFRGGESARKWLGLSPSSPTLSEPSPE